MKEFVQQKRAPLRVVRAPRSAGDVFDFTPDSLDRSFQGWLSAVEATTHQPAIPSRPLVEQKRDSDAATQRRPLQLCRPGADKLEALHPPVDNSSVTLLTTEDYISVMLATIGESFCHTPWPKDVVAKFLAAEVIARGELDDAKDGSVD